jgi:hypothetical protein
VDDEVRAAAGGKGRSGGRLVAIFHYHAISGGASMGLGALAREDLKLAS